MVAAHARLVRHRLRGTGTSARKWRSEQPMAAPGPLAHAHLLSFTASGRGLSTSSSTLSEVSSLTACRHQDM